jgi:hypothetical protein
LDEVKITSETETDPSVVSLTETGILTLDVGRDVRLIFNVSEAPNSVVIRVSVGVIVNP